MSTYKWKKTRNVEYWDLIRCYKNYRGDDLTVPIGNVSKLDDGKYHAYSEAFDAPEGGMYHEAFTNVKVAGRALIAAAEAFYAR